jgi:hypothetical protein
MYAAVELGPGRAQVSFGSARFCESTDSAAAIPPVQSQPSRSSSRSQAVKVKETLVGDWRSMMVVVAKRLWREQRAALFVNQQSFRGGSASYTLGAIGRRRIQHASKLGIGGGLHTICLPFFFPGLSHRPHCALLFPIYLRHLVIIFLSLNGRGILPSISCLTNLIIAVDPRRDRIQGAASRFLAWPATSPDPFLSSHNAYFSLRASSSTLPLHLLSRWQDIERDTHHPLQSPTAPFCIATPHILSFKEGKLIHLRALSLYACHLRLPRHACCNLKACDCLCDKDSRFSIRRVHHSAHPTSLQPILVPARARDSLQIAAGGQAGVKVKGRGKASSSLRLQHVCIRDDGGGHEPILLLGYYARP